MDQASCDGVLRQPGLHPFMPVFERCSRSIVQDFLPDPAPAIARRIAMLLVGWLQMKMNWPKMRCLMMRRLAIAVDFESSIAVMQ